MNTLCAAVLMLCACFALSLVIGELIHKADPENRVKSDKDLLIDSVTQ